MIIEFGDNSYKKETKTLNKNNNTKKRIFSISMVKNEADIIESFVRYHCSIFDGMVIMDSFSCDNTLSILENLKSEGKPIDILKDTSAEFAQSEKMTELLYHTVKKYNPDIVVPLDADEFLTSFNSNGNPINILNRIDDSKVYHIKWMNYIPHISDDKNEKFIPKKIRFARIDKNSLEKVIIPINIVNKHHIKLWQGSHGVENINDWEIERTDELRIAHFPVRSINQIKSKILVGWINNLSRHNRNEAEAWHWRELFEKIKNGHEINEGDMINVAKTYCSVDRNSYINSILNPMDLSFCKDIEIRYTQDEEINPLKNLLENCEQLANQYAALKKQYFK